MEESDIRYQSTDCKTCVNLDEEEECRFNTDKSRVFRCVHYADQIIKSGGLLVPRRLIFANQPDVVEIDEEIGKYLHDFAADNNLTISAAIKKIIKNHLKIVI